MRRQCMSARARLHIDSRHTAKPAGAGVPTRRSKVNAVNLAGKLATFTEYWQPRTVGTFNGHDLMVAKVRGEFTWHKHEDTDDFFLVLKAPRREI